MNEWFCPNLLSDSKFALLRNKCFPWFLSLIRSDVFKKWDAFVREWQIVPRPFCAWSANFHAVKPSDCPVETRCQGMNLTLMRWSE